MVRYCLLGRNLYHACTLREPCSIGESLIFLQEIGKGSPLPLAVHLKVLKLSSDSGTRCSRLAFILSAGIPYVFVFSFVYLHRALLALWRYISDAKSNECLFTF